MASVVMVHGIGHQYRPRQLTRTSWYQALTTGLDDSHCPPIRPDQVEVVHYGNCFRALGGKAVTGDENETIPPLRAGDITDGFEFEFLRAVAAGFGTDAAGDATKTYLPQMVQALIRRIQDSTFVPDAAQQKIVWFIRQVHRYLTEDDLRAKIQSRLAATVTPATRVLVGHSLGSVVAYEGLLAHPEWRIDTFVTLGSPLGLRVVNERMRPPVTTTGQMPAVRRWVNVAAHEDGVASVKHLKTIYGDVEDEVIHNGRLHAHDVTRYLTSAQACEAISQGLVDTGIG